MIVSFVFFNIRFKTLRGCYSTALLEPFDHCSRDAFSDMPAGTGLTASGTISSRIANPLLAQTVETKRCSDAIEKLDLNLI